MEILIEQIKEEGLAIDFEKSAESFPVLSEMVSNGECTFSAPIKTTLRALRISDMVKMDGNIKTSVYLPCSRCLQPFETQLIANFALTYMQRTVADVAEEPEYQEIELNAEDMGIVYFQGEKINLNDTIQEQVVMEFPLRSLCKQDCKGLCPRCGADLNEDPCNCDRKSSSDKFDILKNLKLNN